MSLFKKDSVFKSKEDLGFYITAIGLPVLQFVIFYLVVNFNSLLYSFQTVDIAGNRLGWTFENFSNAWKMMTQSNGELKYAFGNSLVMYFFNLVCGVGLGLLFSYYISKKMPASGFFRVLLFLPSVVSALVMSGAFKMFVEFGIPALWSKLTGEHISGLLANNASRFSTLVFYNVLIGFGASVLMYSNAMSAIPSEVTEAAALDGASGLTEFWFISLPMVFPTLSTFLVTGIATLFTNQMNLFSFYSTLASPEVYTYGYYIYMKSNYGISFGYTEYPLISAIGMLLTLVAVPLTLIVKTLLEKYGPKED